MSQSNYDHSHCVAVAHFNTGVRLAREGKWEEAISEYTMAIVLDATLASAYYNRANAFDRLGRQAEAFSDYVSAVKSDPNHMRAWCNGGISLIKLGKYDQALEYLDKAVSLGDASAARQALALRCFLREE